MGRRVGPLGSSSKLHEAIHSALKKLYWRIILNSVAGEADGEGEIDEGAVINCRKFPLSPQTHVPSGNGQEEKVR